jgi:hypothetical protein
MEITAEIQELLDAQKADLTKFFTDQEAGLKKNRDDLLAEKDERQKLVDDAVKAAAADKLETAKAKGDIETVTASYEEKLLSQADELKQMREGVKASSINSVASKFIAEYGAGDDLQIDAMSREFKARIDVRDGKTVVLDPNGSLTAQTVEDLQQEFITSKRYENCIKGTQARGGDAPGNSNNRVATKKPKDMTGAERKEFKDRDPAGFKKAFNLI